MVEAVRVFFSYSHEDEKLRDKLAQHLSILKWQGLISEWHDRQILPGDEWDHQISQNLETADVILLLVSASFIASRYCWDVEVKRAMERHEAKQACVIPVILRPVDWKGAPFGKLQFLPKNAEPITVWRNEDEAFDNVAKGIRSVVADLLEQRRQKAVQEKHQVALLQYRSQVKEFLQDDGRISRIERDDLDDLREQLDLTLEEAQSIEAEELQPYQQRQENCKRYERTFRDAIATEFPISDRTRIELQRRQRNLSLSDIEVAEIEAPILAAQQVTTPYTQPLPHEPGIDYIELCNLLAVGDWKAADKETLNVMLKAAQQERRGYLDTEDIKNLSYDVLRNIDSLWIHYSRGKFGFSVQKRIWEECGSPVDYNDDWKKFGDRVGWCKDGNWLNYDDLTFELKDSSVGELPVVGVWGIQNQSGLDWRIVLTGLAGAATGFVFAGLVGLGLLGVGAPFLLANRDERAATYLVWIALLSRNDL